MGLRLWILGALIFGAGLPVTAQMLPQQRDVLQLTNWRTHAGDDPAWANPAFDDSQWEKSIAPMRTATIKYQPGFLWYRTTVNLPSALEGRPLAIGMGPVDEVYEVYVDGVSIGSFGQLQTKPGGPFARNLYFPIPAERIHGTRVDIAVRRWRGGSNSNIVVFYSAGGNRFLHPPELGLDATIQDRVELYQYKGFVRNLPSTFSMLALLAAGCISFVLFSAQRQRTEYLFLGFYCAGLPISQLCGSAVATSDAVMVRSVWPVFFFFLYICAQASALLFLSRVTPRFRRWLILGAAIDLLTRATGAYAMATQNSTADHFFWTLGFFPPLIFTVLASLGLFLERKPGSVAIGLAILSRQLAEAWTAFFADRLKLNNLRNIPLGPFSVDFRNICDVVMVSVILIVLYLRFRNEQNRTALFEQDLASARRMQEQLLGDGSSQIPGFQIEAVYRPAKEVGGDFYRTELLDDSSLLIVVGDVSGKGLDAALLVAAVLGGLAIDLERRPGLLLQKLNKAVLGRTGGGFITACCARLYQDGQLIVANAGHISPYLDGKELPVEAGLPLGITANVTYGETRFDTSGGAVTWLSDGVLEAQNPQGELLGFDRMAALTVKPAAEIADAAQQWGQEDDITVLTVCAVATV
jgi:phosphoserine phosphatase RsbU/P